MRGARNSSFSSFSHLVWIIKDCISRSFSRWCFSMLSHQKKLSSLPIVDDWLLKGVDILTFPIEDANTGSEPTGVGFV